MEVEDAEERLDHAKSLKLQGQLYHIVDDAAATVWSDVVQRLPPECLKFALNAAQDTLPHNANLVSLIIVYVSSWPLAPDSKLVPYNSYICR